MMNKNSEVSKIISVKELEEKRKTPAKIYTDPESYATTLLVQTVAEFGLDEVYCLPKTIKMDIEEHYGITLPENNFNKLMAAITILTTDKFTKHLPSFIHICNILCDDFVSFEIFNPANSLECAWGIYEANIIYPVSDEADERFSGEIIEYIKQVLKDENYITVPNIFKSLIKDDYVSEVNYSEENLSYIYSINEERHKEIDFILVKNAKELEQQLRKITSKNVSFTHQQ